MNVFGSMLHLVTFILICLELFIFVFKLCFYVSRPDEYYRIWFLILLILLVMYNLASSLYPDPKINLALNLQNILKYGSGFLTATYFPFYFYKTYNLKTLRFHAFYGAPLFLMLPYLIFFVFIYTMNNNLEFAVNYGFIIPFFYGIVLLRDIPKAIRLIYNESGNREEYIKAMAVFAGLSPWFALIILDYYHASHIVEILLANLGIIVITTILLWKSIKQMRREYRRKAEPALVIVSPELFMANCLHYGYTKTEILVAQRLDKGMSSQEIADSMYSTEGTVNKHIQNMFRKTGVKNRAALLYKLRTRPD